MCGATVTAGMQQCPACGESLQPTSPSPEKRATKKKDWREIVRLLAAVPLFLIGIGILFWLAWKCVEVLVWGGSIGHLWALLAAAVLPFLLGWELVFGRRGDP